MMQSDKFFTLSNDMMFATVLAAQPDLAKEILEIVLDISIDHVVCVNAQKILNYSLDTKYVRLDVFTKDESGIVYDMEIQTKNELKEFLPRRARYYASAADTEIYGPGTTYSKMKDTVIIFICLFDPFDKGRIKYTGKTVCLEDPEVMINDGMKQVYLDAKSYIQKNAGISPELASLLNYIGGKDYDPTPLTIALQKEVEKYNRDKRWRQRAMIIEANRLELEELGRKKGLEEGLEEGRKEGLEEGRREGRKAGQKEGRKEGRKLGRNEGKEEEREIIAFKMAEDGKDDQEILHYVQWTKEKLAEKKKEWKENRA